MGRGFTLHRCDVHILILCLNLILLPAVSEAFFLKNIFGGATEETTTTPAPIIIKYGGDPGEYPYPQGESYNNIIQLADSYPSLTSFPSLYSIPSILFFLVSKLFKGYVSLFPQISYEGNDPDYYNYPPPPPPPSFSSYHNHGPPKFRNSYPPYPYRTSPPSDGPYGTSGPSEPSGPSGPSGPLSGPSPQWVSQEQKYPYSGSENDYQWQEYPPTETSTPAKRKDGGNKWQKRFSVEQNTRGSNFKPNGPLPPPQSPPRVPPQSLPPPTTSRSPANEDTNWLEKFAQNAKYIKSHKTPYETFALSSQPPGRTSKT